jgi:hypothetical protein
MLMPTLWQDGFKISTGKTGRSHSLHQEPECTFIYWKARLRRLMQPISDMRIAALLY